MAFLSLRCVVDPGDAGARLKSLVDRGARICRKVFLDLGFQSPVLQLDAAATLSSGDVPESELESEAGSDFFSPSSTA